MNLCTSVDQTSQVGNISFPLAHVSPSLLLSLLPFSPRSGVVFHHHTPRFPSIIGGGRYQDQRTGDILQRPLYGAGKEKGGREGGRIGSVAGVKISCLVLRREDREEWTKG